MGHFFALPASEFSEKRLMNAAGECLGLAPDPSEVAIKLAILVGLHHEFGDELGLIPKMREWKPWEFDHEIEMIEEPKENPYFAEAARED